MRYLVKGGGGLPLTEQPEHETPHQHRRHTLRRLIAVAFVFLGAFFAYQFFRQWTDSSAAGMVATPDWTDSSEVLVWLRGRVLLLICQLKNTVNGALPMGDFGLIFKVAACAVAATVFLRVPHRN